jgi:hypothetical protein
MTNYFETWTTRLGLPINRSGPVTLPDIVRGLPYKEILRVSGNWTGATLLGSIKENLDLTDELATFTIGTPSFSNGFTSWEYSLTAAQTLSFQPGYGGVAGPFVFDFLLRPSGGEFDRLIAGVVYVSGLVTEAV